MTKKRRRRQEEELAHIRKMLKRHDADQQRMSKGVKEVRKALEHQDEFKRRGHIRVAVR